MPKVQITPHQRRQIISAVLLRRESVSKVAAFQGISKSRVYAIVNEAKTDPLGKLIDAESELELRRRIVYGIINIEEDAG